MIDNLDFRHLTDDNWTRGDDALVREKCEKFMQRAYKKNGVGGLFIIKNRKIDMRKEEIWKQLMAFLNENYL